MKIRKNDWFIIAMFIIAAIVFYGINSSYSSSRCDEKQVVIYSDNKLYKKITIPDNDFTETLEINSSYGKNTVRIIRGGVSVEDSDCRDRICVKSGLITKPGQSVICLPHKLVVEVEGSKTEINSRKTDCVSH